MYQNVQLNKQKSLQLGIPAQLLWPKCSFTKSSGQNFLANKVISLLFRSLSSFFFWCLTGFGEYGDNGRLSGLNYRMKMWNSSSLLTQETYTEK